MKALITAGPTREYIDPVRFITNASTGAIGFEIAKAAKKKGYAVRLISGPTQLRSPAGVKLISIETAAQMKAAVLKSLKWCDCLFMTAAVCDFKPAKLSAQKIKKKIGPAPLKLLQNPDILEAAGKKKGKRKIIGFALETQNLIRNAERKLKEKNLDYIVANKISKTSHPFGPGKTTAVIISREGVVKRLQEISKKQLAVELLELLTK